MDIEWSKHARDRFGERLLKLGLSIDEVEFEIRQRRVKFFQSEKNTIKTIFAVAKIVFTAIKIETDAKIAVISVWESNKIEVDLWKKNIEPASAGEKPP